VIGDPFELAGGGVVLEQRHPVEAQAVELPLELLAAMEEALRERTTPQKTRITQQCHDGRNSIMHTPAQEQP